MYFTDTVGVDLHSNDSSVESSSSLSVKTYDVPPAPVILETLCGFTNSTTNSHFEDCEISCSCASCCFPSAGNNNCYEHNFENCAGYSICSNVFQELVGPSKKSNSTNVTSAASTGSSDSNETAWSLQITEACQAQVVVVPSERKACQDLCDSVLCCFASSPITGEKCNSNPQCLEKEILPCKTLLQYSLGDEGVGLPSGNIVTVSNIANETDFPMLSAVIKIIPKTISYSYPSGTVSVYFDQDIRIETNVSGLESHCSPSNTGGCGIHIHEGASCDSGDEVLGHYWRKSVLGESDPWLNVTYQSNAVGVSEGSMFLRGGNGYSIENVGHAIVIHSQNGNKIACGILKLAKEGLQNVNGGDKSFPEGQDTGNIILDLLNITGHDNGVVANKSDSMDISVSQDVGSANVSDTGNLGNLSDKGDGDGLNKLNPSNINGNDNMPGSSSDTTELEPN